MELSNLPDKEFKVMVIEVLPKLKRRMEEHSENCHEETENKRKSQSELKNTIAKMKNTLEGTNSRLEDAEEWIDHSAGASPVERGPG